MGTTATATRTEAGLREGWRNLIYGALGRTVGTVRTDKARPR